MTEKLPSKITAEVLYAMQFLECIKAPEHCNILQIIRVMGGWIFIHPSSSTFVPFHNEYQEDILSQFKQLDF